MWNSFSTKIHPVIFYTVFTWNLDLLKILSQNQIMIQNPQKSRYLKSGSCSRKLSLNPFQKLCKSDIFVLRLAILTNRKKCFNFFPNKKCSFIFKNFEILKNVTDYPAQLDRHYWLPSRVSYTLLVELDSIAKSQRVRKCQKPLEPCFLELTCVWKKPFFAAARLFWPEGCLRQTHVSS